MDYALCVCVRACQMQWTNTTWRCVRVCVDYYLFPRLIYQAHLPNNYFYQCARMGNVYNVYNVQGTLWYCRTVVLLYCCTTCCALCTNNIDKNGRLLALCSRRTSSSPLPSRVPSQKSALWLIILLWVSSKYRRVFSCLQIIEIRLIFWEFPTSREIFKKFWEILHNILINWNFNDFLGKFYYRLYNGDLQKYDPQYTINLFITDKRDRSRCCG